MAPASAIAKIVPIRVSRRPRSRPQLQDRLTPEELLALLKAARQRSARDWAMILVAYRHGLIASELCGLTFADLDLKDGSITTARLKCSLKTVRPLYQHRGPPPRVRDVRVCAGSEQSSDNRCAGVDVGARAK